MTKQLSVSFTRYEKVLGWIYLPLQMLVIPTVLVFLNIFAGSVLDETQLNFVFFCLNFLLLTVLFHRFLLASARIS